MSSPTISAPIPVVPLDVLAFAEEQGVSKILLELIEWTREVYPTATRFSLVVEDDPEFPDRYIVFDLAAPLTPAEALSANNKWTEGWIRIFPYPRTCVFRLSVEPQ